MAKRSFSMLNFAPTATSDGTVLQSLSFMALQNATATSKTDILEVLLSGLSTASTPTTMVLARSSTNGGTTTALVNPAGDGPIEGYTTPLGSPVWAYMNTTSTATTPNLPTRSSAVTAARLTLALNTFGGIIRWNAAPTQQFSLTAIAAPNGEVSLGASNQGAATAGTMDAHILYEPF